MTLLDSITLVKFLTEDYSSYGSTGSVTHDLNDHSIGRFIKIVPSFEGDSFFVPSMGFSMIVPVITARSKVYHKKDSGDSDKEYRLLTGLWYNRIGSDKRTSSSIIKTISTAGASSNLIKIVTCSRTVYYGGPGLILDSDYKPLMMYGFKMHMNKTSCEFIIDSPICYISPKVFLNTDILSKYIVKCIIPSIISRNTPLPRYYTYNHYMKCCIIIDDMSEFFLYPEKPGDTSTIKDDMWRIITENRDELCLPKNTLGNG